MPKNSGSFTVRCDLDKARIAELVSASILALEDTAKFIEDKLVKDQVTPFATGRLQNSLDISSKKGSVYIHYSAPYADDLYNANRAFNRSINANAQARWMDYLLTTERESIRQYYIKSFKKRGKVR